MPGFGWRYGPRFGAYYAGPESGTEIDRAKVEQEMRELFAKATKGTRWVDPRGVPHIPLALEGGVVGNLWEEADLASLEVASYWAAGFGVKVELARDGRVVGMLWLAV